MIEKRKSWDDIPSINDLKVDWDYEPDNPLGQRRNVRIVGKELKVLFGNDKIPVKLATQHAEYKGFLVDLAQNGAAVLLSNDLQPDEPVKVGMLLQHFKIISKAIIRNVAQVDHLFRVGLEFVDMKREMKDFIGSLVSSKTFSRD